MILLVDIDGDHRADFCVLNSDPNKQSWKPLSSHFAGGVAGIPSSKVRLGDIDVGYIVVFDGGADVGGAVRVYHNTGSIGDSSNLHNFEDWKTVGSGVTGVMGNQVHVADLNGDGRDDYLIFDLGSDSIAHISFIQNECTGANITSA